MGQKIHPLGFRLGVIQKHRSNWYSDRKNYPRWLMEDKWLREHITKKYAKCDANIIQIGINRRQTIHPPGADGPRSSVEITISTPSPANLQQGHENLELAMAELRKECEWLSEVERRKKGGPKLSVYPNIKYVDEPFSHASVVADTVVQQLQQRTIFRTVLKNALTKVKSTAPNVVKGVKIQIAGRLNGAEIARTESVRYGRVPLHTLRADIDYCYKTAKTIYGILGIKVWILK